MGSRNTEARRYAADVRAGVTGAASGCSPHERSDMREQSRISLRHAGYACYSFAPRDAFLAALRADQRARSRFTARTVMGATTCNAIDAAPATSPLTRSNAGSRPKIPHDPASLSQGHRRAALGKKRNGESPCPSPAGPQKKSLYAIVSAREIIPSSHPLKVDSRMQSCHTWVAVRSKTRMTILRKRRRAPRSGEPHIPRAALA